MTNPVHLLSVAALLLVAFLVGAVTGTLARVVMRHFSRKPVVLATAPVEAPVAAPPLVAAPVIAPLPVAPAPEAPPTAQVPVPDFAATLIALAGDAPLAETDTTRADAQPVPAAPGAKPLLPPAMQPARTAGEVTSGIAAAPPHHDIPAQTSSAGASPRSADVIQFPSVPAETPSPATGMIVGGEDIVVVEALDLDVNSPATAVPAPGAPAMPALVETEPAHDGMRTAEVEESLIVSSDQRDQSDVRAPVLPLALEADTRPIPAISVDLAVAAMSDLSLPIPQILSQPLPSVVPVSVMPAVSAVLEEPVGGTVEHATTESLSTIDPRRDTAAAQVAAPVPADPLPPPAEAPPTQPSPVAEPAAQEPALVVEPEQPEVAPPDVAKATTTSTPIEATPPEAQEVADNQPSESSEGPAPLDPALDEDAAMRAIEGSGRPRRAPPRPKRPIPAPEGANEAVAASARAVTAARRTAQAVIAEVTDVRAEARAEAGRPVGLASPRDGRKDDLTHIIGVLPVIETALNKLGLFHFDQVGTLTDENVAWIEAHLGVPGRISRELWREQARELSAVLKPKRAAEN